jgi:CubicO group peptidase (beta-lactamase class C family)
MPALAADRVECLRAAAREVLADHHLPGLGLAVVDSSGLAFAESFGLADIESGLAQSPTQRHRIGSVTKTMIALCALALVDEEDLDLDDPVGELLPDIRLDGYGAEMRLRHLLTHTGGIGEAPRLEDLDDPQPALWTAHAAEVPPVAEQYRDGIGVEVPPGSRWAYANHGWVLVGEIVSRVEEAPIADVVARRIFEPLGMKSSDLLDRPSADLTTGYHRAPGEDAAELLRRGGREVPDEPTVDGHNIRGEYLHVKGVSAGAVQCSLLDLARYAQALLRKSEGIVEPRTFNLMTTPYWCPDPRLAHIGLSFFRENVFGHWSIGHGGGVLGGWNTCLKVFPLLDLGVVVHLNLMYDRFNRVEQILLRALLDAAQAPLPDLPLDARVREQAPGVYEAGKGRLTNVRIMGNTGRIQISEEYGGLLLRARRGAWKAGVRMLPADPKDPYFFELETDDPQRPHVVLTRDDAGRIDGLLHDRLVRMFRNDSLRPWA